MQLQIELSDEQRKNLEQYNSLGFREALTTGDILETQEQILKHKTITVKGSKLNYRYRNLQKTGNISDELFWCEYFLVPKDNFSRAVKFSWIDHSTVIDFNVEVNEKKTLQRIAEFNGSELLEKDEMLTTGFDFEIVARQILDDISNRLARDIDTSKYEDVVKEMAAQFNKDIKLFYIFTNSTEDQMKESANNQQKSRKILLEELFVAYNFDGGFVRE